jgi:acetyltransferase-like isoleucine patch superfamily enzyme
MDKEVKRVSQEIKKFIKSGDKYVKISYRGKGNATICSHLASKRNILRFAKNSLLIWACSKMPSGLMKNKILRLTGAKIGKNVAIGLGVLIENRFPELITIEDGATIGGYALLSAHASSNKNIRFGQVHICKNALVGGKCTTLPGITVGEGATVCAGSLINKDVKPKTFVGGVPIKLIKKLK